jgi:hypothetical protein
MSEGRVVYSRDQYLAIGHKKGLRLLTANITEPITNEELEKRFSAIGVGEGTELMSYIEGRFIKISKRDDLPLIFGDLEYLLVDCDGVDHGPNYHEDNHFFILE